MRLIVSSMDINKILRQAVSDFKRTRQEGTLHSTNEFATAFWQETVCDLVKLSVVSPPVGIRYSHTLYNFLYPDPAEAILDRAFWDHHEIDFGKIIANGLASLTPVEFVLFALQPLGIDVIHDFLNDALQTGEEIADEWQDVYRAAARGMLSTAHKHYMFFSPSPE